MTQRPRTPRPIPGSLMRSTYQPGEYEACERGIALLRQAREEFKRAGASKVHRRILLAISSAKGAIRNRAHGKMYYDMGQSILESRKET